MNSAPQSACSRCGAAFVCGMTAGIAAGKAAAQTECWCTALPQLQQIDPAATCLCPACLQQALASSAAAQ